MPAPEALTDLPLDEFEAYAGSLGQKAFTGRNLRRWVFQRRARDLDAMTDLSRAFRERVAAETRVRRVTMMRERVDGGGTRALLLELLDGQTIETVLIPEGDRMTVCVSTQVGCPVACVFCASGLDGLKRNLSAGEIVEQVLIAQDLLTEGQSVTNVVVMGIGEPTLNLEALVQALNTWNDPRGLGLGARRITVSTVGYPERMDRLAELGKEFGLAVSLHAPRQDLRERLLPGVGKVTLPDLLAAARRYFDATGRRVTFEYVLLRGHNAGRREADELAALLKGFPGIVNLIPVNPVQGLPYERPSDRELQEFRGVLEAKGIQVTQRKTRGDGINAACGQLRLQEASAAS